MVNFGFKIIILGAKGVGKTCLFNRYCFNSFNINSTETIGVNFHSTNMIIQSFDKYGLEKEHNITNSIFDLAGHERFKPLIPKFIEGANGALLVFDSVDQATIEKLNYWYDAIISYAGDPSIPKLLIASKSDLIEDPNKSVVKDEIIQRVIEKKNLAGFYRTSSLKNHNVVNVFKKITELMLIHYKKNLALI